MGLNDVYWRVYVSRQDLACVVCLQDFDECDYEQSRFLTDEKFESEDAAIKWINEKVKEDLIDPEYRRRSSECIRRHFLK